MGSQPQRLPDYVNPPVVETVLGVQFDALARLSNAHLGAFWATLDRQSWPKVLDAPPLNPQFEEFTEAAKWARGTLIHLSQVPASRLQIKSKTGDRMIQVQNGRFHLNWIQTEACRYPRYERVRTQFEEILELFARFIGQSNVGDFQPNQWEVTYVNHIAKGTIWEDPSQWNFFKPLASVPSIPDLVDGESFGGEWHFVIPEKRGRLHISWKHSKKLTREDEEEEMIRLTFTARGPIESVKQSDDALAAILSGLDLGHRTVVLAFRHLMDTHANNYWGLNDGNSNT